MPGFPYCPLSIGRKRFSGIKRFPAGNKGLILSYANIHNLRDVTVHLPLGIMVGIAGVSGSGKSSLISDTLVPKLKEILKSRCVTGEESRNVLNSVVKGILSLAAGVAPDRGLLPGLDVAVADYIPVLWEGRDPLHPPASADNDLRHLLERWHPLPLPDDGADAAQWGLALPYCRLYGGGSAGYAS